MLDSSITSSRYTYTRDHKWPSKAVDKHQIAIRKCGAKGFFVYITALLILASAFYFYLVKEYSITIVYWSFLLDAFLVKWLLRKPVEKEVVVVMPAFGVQLETHYASGKVSREFVPVDKILKPVLLECVTPVTCYWSLSLIVRGEEELESVFKELRPPAKMLVPIWKALCAATGNKESLDESRDDG
ncbi:uncharacterized protein LOC107409703 [Ziziphus jujuba]|uniref:Uncharacterized protein LOC107409703 n=1 Tax=Ziziphus jujuba TaxID=326968 RepID=A0ABM3ISC9_ZIZJJ|nr:uncharacterized protein LOC107409703 [Ziziphus jujuba]XP_048334565.2 uncharacterized protein LOC107409703 [Ziziphus jujuba]